MFSVRCFIAAIALLTAHCSLEAQSIAGRDLVVYPPFTLVQSGTTAISASNQCDLHSIDGPCRLVLDVVSNKNDNSVTATCAVSVNVSTTGTNNWVAITNLAQSTYTLTYNTNVFAGGLISTNPYDIAGTLSNAVPSVQGFAGLYIVPAPFTNGAAITATAGGAYEYVLNSSDQPRYLQIQIAATGSNAVYSIVGHLIPATATAGGAGY